MPRVLFTKNLRRHLEVAPDAVPGTTVRQVLDALFQKNPKLRGYILDDQGELRKHVVIFVDSAKVEDREQLADPVREQSEIYVMQALTGGSSP